MWYGGPGHMKFGLVDFHHVLSYCENISSKIVKIEFLRKTVKISPVKMVEIIMAGSKKFGHVGCHPCPNICWKFDFDIFNIEADIRWNAGF